MLGNFLISHSSLENQQHLIAMERFLICGVHPGTGSGLQKVNVREPHLLHLSSQMPRESRKGSPLAREPPKGLWKLSRAGLPDGRFSPRVVGEKVPPHYKEIGFCGGRFQPGRETEVPPALWERTREENAYFSRVQSPSECEAGQALCLLKTPESPVQASPSLRSPSSFTFHT